MSNKKNVDKDEQVTDVKGTIVGFVAPDPEEQTQEQEIQNFRLKKESEKELARLSEEEQKKKKEEYQKEEKRLEQVKTELLKSIKERIPAIEQKFKLVISTPKKRKVVEKVDSKTRGKLKVKEEDLQKEQEKDEKERE